MTPTRWRFVLLLCMSTGLMALTSCPPPYYLDHQFALSAAPPSAFVLPDSSSGGAFLIRLADRGRYPSCVELQVYDLWQVRRGGRIGPAGQNGVYVGFDTLAGPTLHVLMRNDPARPTLPRAYPGIVARLALQGSGLAVDSFPTKIREVGAKKAVTDWCKGERW